MSRSGIAFIDGEIRPIEQAVISIFDWGFLRSDGCYDLVHVWKGYLFRLEDHLERFERSLEAIRLRVPHDRDALRDIVLRCVKASGLRDAYVHLGCTRGIPAGNGRDPRKAVNNFFSFVVPFTGMFDQRVREDGLRIAVTSVQGIPKESVSPEIKNYNRLHMSMCLFEAYDRGADTGLLVDRHGGILEGPGFNVFVVKHGCVLTPRLGVLLGITRRTVLELCNESVVAFSEGEVTKEMLWGADEVFLTSSAGGLLWVSQVDGKEIGGGRQGTVSARLDRLYWQKKEAGWYGTRVLP